ncbi:hypothetical protein BpHYR1_025930 [Brachionus plicatilis]|uniref:G-protein coupled receptors family 1 profile domain-containing protein n=1 Tax=Brachionus plicatilis TaxID=10195 RepID=A0A3M7SLX8_BRAPC|nr:hypothetical protein BpHYR1_025930 [Brachionus plicatilis]
MLNSSKLIEASLLPHSSGLVYFFNRSDRYHILELLSPLRTKLEKTIPIFHYMGLLTNLVCFLVLMQNQMINRKSIFYLVFLAFSDFMYNFLSELPNFLILIRLSEFNIYKRSNLSCFFYDYGPSMFHFFSVLLTLFVTAERFNHIYNPLKFNRAFFVNNKKHKLLIGLSLLAMSCVLALPRGFLMVYNSKQNECDARHSLTKSLFNTTWTYYNIYFTFTEPILIWFIPGILISCMNFYSKQINTYRFITSLNSKLEPKSQPRHNSAHKPYEQIIPIQEAKVNRLNNHRFLNDFFGCSPKNVNSQSASDEFEMENMFFRRKQQLYQRKEEKKKSASNSPLLVLGSDYSINVRQKYDDCRNFKSLTMVPLMADRSSMSNKRRSVILNLNRNTSKISANQISHYITIIILGFYLIFSTIPYAILLSLQNNSTLYLNYELRSMEDYLSNKKWLNYGLYRECVVVAKLFFVSNHCFNFFLYFLFNRLFRITLIQLFCLGQLALDENQTTKLYWLTQMFIWLCEIKNLRCFRLKIKKNLKYYELKAFD